MLLLALNEGFDRKSIAVLLILEMVGVYVSGDGLIECAGLIASGLVKVRAEVDAGKIIPNDYRLDLTQKGRIFLDAWKKGDQETAVNAGV